MSRPKFSVGDIVELDYPPHARGAIGWYRIIRLVPYRRDEPLYRIKSICEQFERNVRESQLTLIKRSPGDDNDAFDNVALPKGKSRRPNLH
jgi:hypothetical protein